MLVGLRGPWSSPRLTVRTPDPAARENVTEPSRDRERNAYAATIATLAERDAAAGGDLATPVALAMTNHQRAVAGNRQEFRPWSGIGR